MWLILRGAQRIILSPQVVERHSDSPSSYSLDTVSQLDRDASTALITIRKWRNSFAPINRIPSDVLSLFATHLPSQKDRFYATHVCRHWRRTFLQYGTLWSQLILRNDEAYVKTILERAKGSSLDLTIDRCFPIDGVRILLSPHSQQVRYLRYVSRENALKSLNSFPFQQLTTFELSARATNESESDLFNFLKASPMLRTVKLRITGATIPGNNPRESIVVLPNVETFLLEVTNGRSVFDLAAQISCPRSRDTSIEKNMSALTVPSSQTIFPPRSLLNSITHQYMRNPVEEVTLEVGTLGCSLTFRSFDRSTIRFGCILFCLDPGEFSREVLSGASRTIWAHPQLPYIKRLSIKYWHRVVILDASQVAHVAREVERLFRSMKPLDELTIEGWDLRVFPAPFLHPEEPVRPNVFPQIKRLVILRPVMEGNEEECMEAIVELAKYQHAKGMPFERVTVRASAVPAAVAERLARWVGVVDCYEDQK